VAGAELVGAFLRDLILLLIPFAAFALVAVRCRVTHPVLLLCAAVGGSGLLGFAVFWLYLINPHVGRTGALVVTLGCVAVLADGCRQRFAGWRALRPLLPPTALFSAAGLFYLGVTYFHGGFTSQADVPAYRFTWNLPADNIIPKLFAEQLLSVTRPLPAILSSGWQASARPPLQTGYYLMQQAVLAGDHFTDYQILATLLQGVWILGLWALLYAARKNRWAVALCLGTMVFAGFTIYYSVFTWPKLVAAGAMFLVAAVLLTPQLQNMRDSRVAGLLTGAVLATAMLAHPGSVFAVFAIAVAVVPIWLWPRLRPADWKPPTWRFLWPAGAALLVGYGPWMLFQKYYQPPGNQLTNLQLANVPDTILEPTSRAVIDAYRHTSLSVVLSNKLTNFAYPFEGTFGYLKTLAGVWFHTLTGNTKAASADAVTSTMLQFFHIVPILGLAGWGLPILLGLIMRRALGGPHSAGGRSGAPAAHRAGEAADGARITYDALWLLGLVVMMTVWALVLFGPSATVAHSGTSYVEPILMSLGVLGFWYVSRKLALVVAVASAVLTLLPFLAYTPGATMTRLPGTGGVWVPDTLITAVGAAACVICLWWIGREDPLAEPAAAWPAVPEVGKPKADGAVLADVSAPVSRQSAEAGAPPAPEPGRQ
jgi:hypothetical protein